MLGNFTYSNPTKRYFGEDSLSNLHEELAKYGKTVQLVTGGGSVSHSLKADGRLIDTAHIYGNEIGVGQGVGESGVPREDVFITTKLYMNQYSNAEAAIDRLDRWNGDWSASTIKNLYFVA